MITCRAEGEVLEGDLINIVLFIGKVFVQMYLMLDGLVADGGPPSVWSLSCSRRNRDWSADQRVSLGIPLTLT